MRPRLIWQSIKVWCRPKITLLWTVISSILILLWESIPLISIIMIILDFWVSIAIFLMGIAIARYFHFFITYFYRTRIRSQYTRLRLLSHFLSYYIWIIILFSFAHIGIMKTGCQQEGLFTLTGKRLEYRSFEEYIDIFYFGVATATTLGYGDITPRGLLPKLAVIIEVITIPVIVLSFFSNLGQIPST